MLLGEEERRRTVVERAAGRLLLLGVLQLWEQVRRRAWVSSGRFSLGGSSAGTSTRTTIMQSEKYSRMRAAGKHAAACALTTLSWGGRHCGGFCLLGPS